MIPHRSSDLGRPCIYCGAPADSDEHWLPRGLGAIKNLRLLKDRLCATCNRELGKLDEELARTGPTGFFKAAQGIRGRAKHNEVSPFLYRAMSPVQPTKATMPAPHGQYEILAEVYRDRLRSQSIARPLRQLVFKTRDESIVCVPLNRAWMAAHLKTAIQERKLEDATLVEVFLAPDEDVLPGMEVRQLLTEAVGMFSATVWGGVAEEGSVKTVTLASGIDTKYLRALAKVGFHYFLHTTTAYRGDETEFSSLRQFIRVGDGAWRSFVELQSQQFVPEFANNLVPEDWTHVFLSDASRNVAVTRVQFFVGPENLPPPSLIRLGTNLRRIGQRAVTCHWVKYYGDKVEGYDAEINEVNVSIQPAHEAIRLRAYELWEQRGRGHGNDVDD